MNKRTAIVNMSGDHEESLVQFARHLGTDKIRRKVFETIYGRGTLPRSKKQIMKRAEITDEGANAQQVQNALDHLSKHHLIVKSENDGSVNDGSRNLFGKDESVRANRSKIVRYADNPKAAAVVPTKRRPVTNAAVPVRQVTRQTLRKQKHLTVLYLTASPDPDSPLQVDMEVKKVQEKIKSSRFRDNVTVEYRPAADLNSLIEGLNDHRPQIVHFSGHGNEGGIATDGEGSVKELSFELFANALKATDEPPQIIILNSCKSSAAKKALLPVADLIITMQTSVSDAAATVFAQYFYAAIASGQSVKSAFEQGKVNVENISISEGDTPELQHTSQINPAKMILT